MEPSDMKLANWNGAWQIPNESMCVLTVYDKGSRCGREGYGRRLDFRIGQRLDG